MSDRFSGHYDILVDASPHNVAEFCRDPRRIFATEFHFSDLTLTQTVVGTTARGISSHGGHEHMTIEYTDYIPDHRIAFKADPTITIAKLGWVVTFPTHLLTWTFTPEAGGTRLAVEVIELDPPWWDRLLDKAFQRSWATLMHARLARIKAAAEAYAATAPP